MSKAKILVGSLVVVSILTGSYVMFGKKNNNYTENDIYEKEGVFYEKSSSDLANGIQRKIDNNGKLVAEIIISDGKRDGKMKEYYPSGGIEEETDYIDGKKSGIQKEFFENGQVKVECEFKNDEPTGIEKSYFESGELRRETPFNDGKIDGIEKRYYKNGQLVDAVEYKNGSKEGLRKGYQPDGSLYVEVTYQNNKPVDGYIYRKDGRKDKMTQRDYINLFGFNG